LTAKKSVLTPAKPRDGWIINTGGAGGAKWLLKSPPEQITSLNMKDDKVIIMGIIVFALIVFLMYYLKL
jgi:hypothetical protein